MTVRVICDSSQNVPESYLESLAIIECPASIVFQGQAYLNKVEMSHAEFYQRLLSLPSGSELPTTTQPSPGQFKTAVDQAKAQGADGAIITSVSARLSGTYNSAIQAAQMERDIPVAVWDTESASMGGGWQTIVAAEMARDGASVSEIMAALPGVRNGTTTAFTVDTLNYIVASGRLSNLQGIVGTLLNIKPLLLIEDAVLKPVGRERGRKRSKAALIELIHKRTVDRPLRVAVMNANVPEEAAAFAEDVKNSLNPRELLVLEIGPVLAAIAGPGVLAVAALQVAL